MGYNFLSFHNHFLIFYILFTVHRVMILGK